MKGRIRNLRSGSVVQVSIVQASTSFSQFAGVAPHELLSVKSVDFVIINDAQNFAPSI